mmetsp:Transcript_13546/g.20555  ORF Transcript_13546/g.20555 Transcript_13546/m.20555 type:complete len:237 (+) Transcript_13546:65-775(+)
MIRRILLVLLVQVLLLHGGGGCGNGGNGGSSIYVNAQTPSCPHQNERYTRGASSSCFEESCSNVLEIYAHKGTASTARTKRCSRDLKSGCQCKPGYFRNHHDGRCVTELTCIHCGYNEDWVDRDVVGIGTTEEEGEEEEKERQQFETCNDVILGFSGYGYGHGHADDGDDYDDDDDFINKTESDDDFGSSAPLPFVPNCQCAKGYYRRLEDGLCVNIDSCLECGPNEVYESCRSST